MSRKPPKSRVRRRARANPKPRAWSAKGPSRAYECKSPLVGRTVRLGRSEAVVESCATPSRRRPNQGQFRVRSKATGKSRAVPRRRVSAALYRAKHPRKMPAGLLKFWSKTREGGSARPSMAEAYGPRESLGVGAFEEARALPYGPRESLGTGAFEERRALPAPMVMALAAPAAPVRKRPARRAAARSSNAPELPLHFGFGAGTADPLRPDRRHAPLPSAHFGPGGAEAARHVPLGYGPGGFEEGRSVSIVPEAKPVRPWLVWMLLKMTWRGSPLPKQEPRWITNLNGKTRTTRFNYAEKDAWVPAEVVLGYAMDPQSLVEATRKWTEQWVERLRAKQLEAGESAMEVHVVDVSVSFSSPVRSGGMVSALQRRVMHSGPQRVVAFYMPAYSKDPKVSDATLKAAGAEAKEVLDRRPSASPRVISDEAREQMRDNPMHWRANHHGGWHAPGDPLGYGPRTNRTRRTHRSLPRSRHR